MFALTKEKDRKSLLKTLSTERVQHWPNTLEANRLKKLNHMKEKEAHEESIRQEQDRVEAEIQKTVRYNSIKRAKDLLFEQTDRMKLLKSQTEYAEVLHSRHAQIEMKRKKKMDTARLEDMYHSSILETVRIGDATEEEKKAKAARQIGILKSTRSQQIQEIQVARKAQADEEIAIGISLKKRAKEMAEEELEKYRVKQEKAEKANAQMVEGNEKLKLVRDSILLREREEELSREAAVENIEMRKQARKDLAKMHFEKQQTSRQKIIDRAVEQLAKASNTEAVLLAKQENELKEKQDKAERDKQAARDKEWAAIVKSRADMKQRKYEEWQEANETEQRMVAAQRALRAEADVREEEKQRKRKESEDKVKMNQKMVGQAIARKRIEDKLLEQERSRLLMANNTDENQRFIDICKLRIKDNLRQGKPVYTLLKAMEYQDNEPLLPAVKGKRKPKNKDED